MVKTPERGRVSHHRDCMGSLLKGRIQEVLVIAHMSYGQYYWQPKGQASPMRTLVG